MNRLTNTFIGREHVFSIVDDFLHQNNSGYFTLVADAGLGKTAIAAAIARRYDAIAFFFNSSQGMTSQDECLSHIIASLITRFGDCTEISFERAKNNSFFFSKILEDYAKRSQVPLIIVIDAIDEADGKGAGQNILRLPESLPNNVYIFITRRAGFYPHTVSPATKVYEYCLRWNDEGQQRDIKQYLNFSCMHNESLAQVIAQSTPRIDIDLFVEALRISSQGNFKYLEYVIEGICVQEGEFTSSDLDQLPYGLKTYYNQFWDHIQQMGSKEGWQVWDKLYRPVIGLLAAAIEPVPMEWLSNITKRKPVEIKERAIDKWRRFLSMEVRNGVETWRIVHKSFADFVQEKIDLTEANKTIADYFYQMPDRWCLYNNYALHNLCAHLYHNRDIERLSKLLDNQMWYDAQLQLDPSGSSYISDIHWMLSLCEKLDELKLNQQKQISMIGQEMKCALMTGTLHSIASSLTPQILKALIQYGFWSPENALNAISQMNEPRDISNAICEIVEYIPQHLYQDTLLIVQQISEENLRVETLEALLPHTPEAVYNIVLGIIFSLKDIKCFEDIFKFSVPYFKENEIQKILTILAKNIESCSWHVDGELEILAPHLKGSLLEQAIQLARSAKDTTAYAVLLPYLSEPMKSKILKEAFSITSKRKKSFWDGYIRAKGLAAIAPLVSKHEAKNLLDEAWKATESLSDDLLSPYHVIYIGMVRSDFIDEAVARAKELQGKDEDAGDQVLFSIVIEMIRLKDCKGALRTVHHIHDIDRRDYLLSKLVAQYVELKNLDMAIELLFLISDVWRRAELLPALAKNLNELQLQIIITKTLNVDDAESNARRSIIRSIIDYLNEAQLRQIIENSRSWEKYSKAELISITVPRLAKYGHVDEAWAMVRKIAAGPYFADAIEKMGSFLSDEQLQKALSIANQESDLSRKIDKLKALVPYLHEPEKQRVLLRALNYAKKVEISLDYNIERKEALNALAPLLIQNGYPHLALKNLIIFNKQWRVIETIVNLVPYSTLACKDTALEYCFELSISSESDDMLASGLADLGPQLPQSLLYKALEIALDINWANERVFALYGLVGYIKNKRHKEAMLWETIETMKDVEDYIIVYDELHSLLPHFSKEQIIELCSFFQDDPKNNGEFLIELIPFLQRKMRQDIINNVLEALINEDNKKSDRWNLELLSKLIPFLPEKKRKYYAQQSFVNFMKEKSLHSGDEILPRIAPYLYKRQWTELIEKIWNDDSVSYRIRLQNSLAPFMSKSMLGEAYEDAMMTRDDYSNTCALGLVGLAYFFDEEKKQSILSEATEAILPMTDPYDRAQAITLLQKHLLALSHSELYNTYRMILDPITKVSRDVVLLHIKAITPLLHKLGGKTAVDQTIEAIIETSDRWTKII